MLFGSEFTRIMEAFELNFFFNLQKMNQMVFKKEPMRKQLKYTLDR